MHEADQRRHFDQRAHHGGEGHARVQAEDRDGDRDRQFEVVARGSERERRGTRIVGSEPLRHGEADAKHDREV